MHSFIAKLAAVLAAMPTFVRRRIKVAGAWISQLVAVPAQPAATPATNTAAQSDESAAHIKRLAGVLAQGKRPVSDDLKGSSEKSIKWLQAMDRRELCRLMCADDRAIHLHMRGKQPLKGLVPYDPQAITEVTKARRQAAKPQRTLRDVLAEREARERNNEPESAWAPAA